MIRAVLLAAVNGGNRKTWQLLLPTFQFGSNIFSSHILSEVRAMCDRIIMIAKGKLAAFDTPENLEKHLLSHNEVVLTTNATADEARTLLGNIDHITDLTLEAAAGGLVTARVRTDLSSAFDLSRRIFSVFAAGGGTLLELTVKKANLEDIFLELAEEEPGAPAEEADLVESEVTEE